jgi:hypothetical protein
VAVLFRHEPACLAEEQYKSPEFGQPEFQPKFELDIAISQIYQYYFGHFTKSGNFHILLHDVSGTY